MTKGALKHALRRIGLYERASRAWIWTEPKLTNAVRALSGRDQQLIRQYLQSTAAPALHIGAGANHLDGWLNTELCPRGEQIFLDATKPFPLPTGAFDFVYSEHMIEHIAHADALRMLRECHRVLKPGGVIRIVTPNLAFLKTLIEEPLDPVRAAYVRFYQREHRIPGPDGSGPHVFNHFVRAWGHQFIYDQNSLGDTLRAAGFVDVRPCALTESPHDRLRGVAKVDRMPDGFLALESITVEAQTPAH